MVRVRLWLLCLAAICLHSPGRADEAEALNLLKRVEAAVVARSPIIVESILTVQSGLGRSRSRIRTYQFNAEGSGYGSTEMEGTENEPMSSLIVPTDHVNP